MILQKTGSFGGSQNIELVGSGFNSMIVPQVLICDQHCIGVVVTSSSTLNCSTPSFNGRTIKL